MTTIGQGLNLAGLALAQGLMARKEKKGQERRMQELIAALVGEDITPEQTPGYGENMSLAASMLGNRMPGSPVPQLAPAAMAQVLGEGQAAGINKEKEIMRALLMSGDPRAEQIALSRLMPSPMKPMSVAGGYVDDEGFHRTEQQKLEIKNIDGTVLGIDTVTGESKEIFKTDPKNKVQLTEMGVGGQMTRALVVTDPDGNVVRLEAIGDPWSTTQKIEQTNIEGPSLGGDAPFMRKAQADISAAHGATVRLGRMADTFAPFFQSVPGKVATWGVEMIDRLLPRGLPKGAAKDLLSAKTSFAQYTNENMNLYIKMITGAQMSEAEATRLSKAVANLGDSPTQFETKLRNSQRVMAEAAAILEEELQFYAGVQGMDYEEALKYAQKKAANHIRMGLADIEAEADRYDAEYGTKESGAGDKPPSWLTVPSGYKAVKTSDGWKVLAE